MTKPMTEQHPSTKLLTLINVNQARPAKRKRANARDWYEVSKKFSKVAPIPTKSIAPLGKVETGLDILEYEGDISSGAAATEDSYEKHWGSDSRDLGSRTVEELAEIKWMQTNFKSPVLGNLSQLFVEDEASYEDIKGNETVSNQNTTNPDISTYFSTMQCNPRLMAKLESRMQTSRHGSITSIQQTLFKLLASYRDVFYPKIDIKCCEEIRTTIALHAMNHVLRTRSRVLKNNEYLARAADSTSKAPPRETLDQGFTRPKVLILLPFRNSASVWIDLLTTISLADNIENKSRFDSEFSLPEGAVDKLAQDSDQYAADHVKTFAGNIDDSFRLGLKVTRKSIKLFSEFYSCDVIIASPLGLRQSIEKEKDADFLSSIEVLVIDQMDTMLMQNWDHVKFVLDRMNKLPQESHGCDFSRVKPWYLDGKSSYLRQSILLSSYETPELRALYTKSLVNVAGKIKAEEFHLGRISEVPKGIKQVFTRFECADVYSEDDSRFEHFTTKTFPMLLKSAVSSSQTIIFIPSYFDFVRVKRFMTKFDDISFTSISEYTSTPDVSRARGAFFSGKKSFLLITERFHFFRRYKIKGAKTVVFYAPPDHAHYYIEMLTSSSAVSGTINPIEEPELNCQVLFSRFDLLRLERLCGSENARKMIGNETSVSRFTFLES